MGLAPDIHNCRKKLPTSMPVWFHPDWRTEEVLALSKTMSASQDFTLMPILADALEDAGCDCEAVLLHLRRCKRHYASCWVGTAISGYKSLPESYERLQKQQEQERLILEQRTRELQLYFNDLRVTPSWHRYRKIIRCVGYFIIFCSLIGLFRPVILNVYFSFFPEVRSQRKYTYTIPNPQQFREELENIPRVAANPKHDKRDFHKKVQELYLQTNNSLCRSMNLQIPQEYLTNAILNYTPEEYDMALRLIEEDQLCMSLLTNVSHAIFTQKSTPSLTILHFISWNDPLGLLKPMPKINRLFIPLRE